MRIIIAASAVAVGASMCVGAGTAAADSVQVAGNYSTLAACQADGPHVEITGNNALARFNCLQGGDGLYYLFLNT